MRLSRATRIAIPCLIAAAASAASAQGLEVIYTKISGHPTAVIPGAIDLKGNPVFTEWRALEDFAFSPDGSRWVIKGRTQLGSDLETILVMGSGTKGTMFAQEGQPIPGGAPGELFDFFGSGLGRFNNHNHFAYSARARGGASSVFQKVIVFDGVSSSIAFQMGDLITGLVDNPPNPSGDEIFGNSVGSIHILDNGVIGSQDSTIGNIHTSRRPAIMYDTAAFHQSNVTTITDLSGGGVETWKSIGGNSFYTTPDGAHWIAQGTVNQTTDIDAVLVVDGRVVLQEGMLIPASNTTMTAIFAADIASSGVWYARGDDPNDNDWAVVNHVLVAKTGDPIVPKSDELWGDTFSAFCANAAGDWVLVGNTSDPDASRDMVMVLNGTTVIAREGDQVDLDGDGILDDAYIGRGNNTLAAFEANDVFIGPDGYVYFFANLRNAAGEDLNSNPSFGTPQAFFRVFIGESCVARNDATQPGDPIVPSSPNHPAGEPASAAIDNTARTKYLNFDRFNTGFTVDVTPCGNATVNYVTIITANDAPARDPVNFILEGSDDGKNFITIASGDLNPSLDRFAISSSARFENDFVYDTYRITFPDVRTPDGANSMQVAEVQLASHIDITSPDDAISITIPKGAFIGPGEGPANLFDNRLNTKLDVQGADLGPVQLDVEPFLPSVVTGFTYFSANDDVAFPGRTPQNITLLGSNDGVKYTEIFSTPVEQATDNYQDQEFIFNNNTAYRLYRIIFDVPHSSTDMQMGEFQLLGTTSTEAPGNDECANAFVIGAGTVSGTTNFATGSDITPCGNDDAIDVWYSYTPAKSGLVEVNTCQSEADTTLAIFSSCDGKLIACDDNGCGGQSLIRFDAVGGTTYIIRVALTGGATGTFRLAIDENPDVHDDIPLALNYNFNGMTHEGEAGMPDAPDGYRSISDRGLEISANIDSIGFGTLRGLTGIVYEVEPNPNVVDIVHLGNRNTVDSGNRAFDALIDGDNIGIQPDWLPDPNQTGPQTSDVSAQSITFSDDTRVGVLYQISNAGGSFSWTLTFDDNSSATVVLQGPDWFFNQHPAAPGLGVEAQAQLGVFRATENVDMGVPGTPLNVVEAITSTEQLRNDGFGDFSGKRLVSMTFSDRSNSNAGYAIIAASVRDADTCRADFNGDGLVNSQDFFDFLVVFFANDPQADFNRDGLVNSQDFFDFLTVFFTGC